MSSVGERLRSFADKEFGGITRLASKLGISQPRLSNYVRGANEIPVDILLKLADLGCDIHWLMTGQSKEELDKGTNNFFIRKARELMPAKFEILDYLESIGLDTPEKVKSVCDPQGIAEDVAMVMRERMVKYRVKKKRKR